MKNTMVKQKGFGVIEAFFLAAIISVFGIKADLQENRIEKLEAQVQVQATAE